MSRLTTWLIAIAASLAIAASPLLDGPTDADADQASADAHSERIQAALLAPEPQPFDHHRIVVPALFAACFALFLLHILGALPQ